MKRILLILGILALSIELWADVQPYIDYGSYKKGQVVILYGDKVNIRKSPDPKSQVMDRLSISTKVQIIEKSKEVYTMNGYTESWYKVKYPCTCGKKIDEGYIWGGMLAKAVIIKEKGNRYAPKVVVVGARGKTNDHTLMEARYVEAMTILSTVRFTGLDMSFDNSFSYTLGATTIKKNLFRKDLQLIVLGFTYEADEFAMGDIMLVLKGKKLIYGFKSLRSFSEFGRSDFHYIWPNEEKGIKDTILVENISEDYEAKQHAYSYERYLWTGDSFIKTED